MSYKHFVLSCLHAWSTFTSITLTYRIQFHHSYPGSLHGRHTKERQACVPHSYTRCGNLSDQTDIEQKSIQNFFIVCVCFCLAW